MGRTARILTWSAAILVGLIVLTVGAAYLFVTSDDFRSRVESSASAYSGRKTHIAKISIDWGSTAHVRLDGVEVANADWGKSDHMLKAEQVDFDIRLWPLLKGDFVLPSLVLRKPEVALEVGDKEQLNWSLGESPVTTGVAKAVAPKERDQTPLIGRLEITDGRLSYQDTKRKLSLDGTVSTAEGRRAPSPRPSCR
ncbi:MAG TPA: AsmA family protein [Reyranella sp.]|nr:AsmA family protein [Reyranella sp.]